MPVAYSRLQIALHWVIAILFAANYIVSDDMKDALRAVARGAAPEGIGAAVHVWGGVLILALTLVRIAVRVARGAPELPDKTPPLVAAAAKWGHLALYVLLLALTGSGIAAWFGGIDEAGEAHEVIVNLTLLVILAHAGAALYHQYVLKDGLLTRMLRAS